MDDLSGKAKDGELLPAEQLQSMGTTTSLVCLNFKVPLRIRQQFKIHAAEHNMSMTELLLHLLNDCLISDVHNGPVQRTKEEIKK
jgi:hypothetical protein